MKLFLPILVLLLIISCKKGDKSKTRAELLANGSWHVTAYTVDPALDFDGNGTDETDAFAVMEACVKDDHTTFYTNGTAELDEGATKCSDSDPQTIPLTWQFAQDETELRVQRIDYLLESLTETQLVVKEIETISQVTYTHTVTFSH